MIFKYVIDGQASQSVKYKIIYPLGEKISVSFLSAVKSAISGSMEFLSDGDSSRRPAETLSEKDFNIIAKELYDFLEKHYLFNALAKRQFSKTICRETMVIAVPYSEKISFIYRGRRHENNAEVNLTINEGLNFYGLFCGDTFYFQNSSEMAEFSETGYGVILSSLELLKADMTAAVRKHIKSRIKGDAANLPCRRLDDDMRKQLQNQCMDIARSNYINDRIPIAGQYLADFPSAGAEARLSKTESVCEYLSDATAFAARESAKYINENWKSILYSIERERMVACEMARLAEAGI